MADDRLRLTAELVDKVSGPAKRMAASFDALKRASAKELPDAFRKYQRSVEANEKALSVYGRRALSTGRELTAFQNIVRRTSPVVAGLTDEIGAFSIGAGSAVGAIAAVGAGLLLATRSAAKFAEQMRTMRFASKETGFSMTQLKQFEILGPKFGISAERMAEGLDTFAGSMLKAHRDSGAFQQQLSGVLGNNAIKYTARLQAMAKAGASSADEFKEMSDILSRIKKDIGGAEGERIAGMLAGFLTGDTAFGRMDAGAVKDKMAGSLFDEKLWQKTTGSAEHLAETMDHFYEVSENWKNLLAKDAIPGIDHMVEGFTTIANKAQKLVDTFTTLSGISAWKIFGMAFSPLSGGATG